MSGFSFSKLAIQGYRQQAVPNEFLRQNEPAPQPRERTLGVLFPGLYYTNQNPLMYYTGMALLQLGADVLRVNADYSRPEYQNAPPDQQAAWLAEDAAAAVQAAQNQGDYGHLVLAGKSLGSLAVAQLLARPVTPGAVVLWLTPLLHLPPLVEVAAHFSGPALFVAGSDDPAFDPQAFRKIQEANGSMAHLVKNANHSLDIPGDVLGSIEQMAATQAVVLDFLKKHLQA